MARNRKKILNTSNEEIEKYLSENPTPKIFKKGDVVEGEVKGSKTGELIVDIKGRTEGVITGKELRLDGKKVEKQVGDRVLVYVIKPENEEGQVELSIRRTGMALKWHELEQARKEEKVIEVRVLEANTGGVLVEVEPGGMRGFVPSSQLKNSRIYSEVVFSKKEDASKALQSKLAELIDQTIKVKVMEIDREKSKIILSEKSVYSDAGDVALRNQTLSGLKVGDMLEGTVTGIAPFGLFVNAQGLEGLVHLSEISWDKVMNPADFYKLDQIVKVQVIGFGDSGKRVAYSIKRLNEDPWKDLVKKYQIGQVVEGEVKSVAQYGVFVKIEDGLNGLIHISELSNKLVKDPNNVVKVGDIIKVMIISISHDDRHLGLSLKKASAPVSSKKGVTTSEEVGDLQMKELDKMLEGDGDTVE